LSLSKLSLENAAATFVEASKSLADVQSRHEMMENILSIYESQFRATTMQTGLPTETTSSIEMYNEVVNQEDFEHKEETDTNNEAL